MNRCVNQSSMKLKLFPKKAIGVGDETIINSGFTCARNILNKQQSVAHKKRSFYLFWTRNAEHGNAIYISFSRTTRERRLCCLRETFHHLHEALSRFSICFPSFPPHIPAKGKLRPLLCELPRFNLPKHFIGQAQQVSFIVESQSKVDCLNSKLVTLKVYTQFKDNLRQEKVFWTAKKNSRPA